ncbi:MAG TPA: homocysteine S-methyltransferase family protein [Geminicoccaceae bacterium]|nr:homocysteine S-methyltransferase family protein [Geminicoccaceae bacterium]
MAAKHRHRLPQVGGDLFLADGGIETTLIFHDGLELPLFAAFHLLKDQAGREALRRYYAPYVTLARNEGLGFILESPTWRASPDWAKKLGYTGEALDRANRDAIALMRELREGFAGDAPMVISGCVGPRGDGYHPERTMDADEAEAYHARQIRTFAETDADMVTAIIMTHTGEAIGVTRAARAAGMPVAISFTLEIDGRLPSGEALGDAIQAVDEATGEAPAYFMVNCAHPTHFTDVLADTGGWARRIRGVRANASKRSHAELDEAQDLDDGDPAELAGEYAALGRLLPELKVLGGCCGTDHRHVAAICRACVPSPATRGNPAAHA